jgi:HlyD family secretion protein
MTAVVEIHVDRLEDVLCVPVQAVVQVEHETWCFVDSSNGVVRRPVTLGRSNDKFVQISEGLEEGERVVLNPMALDEGDETKERTISPES